MAFLLCLRLADVLFGVGQPGRAGLVLGAGVVEFLRCNELRMRLGNFLQAREVQMHPLVVGVGFLDGFVRRVHASLGALEVLLQFGDFERGDGAAGFDDVTNIHGDRLDEPGYLGMEINLLVGAESQPTA